MSECEVPLTERLEAIPHTARIVIEENHSSQNIPIGAMCHEASKRIKELAEQKANSFMLELEAINSRGIINRYGQIYKDIKDQVTAQGQKGTWDSDEYMRGLYNGLELALAQMEEREPNFK